ncbi:MAG: hypothetical protein EXS15_02195 [Phycisphaerales bacterium]|nr:hypothetical protein [Phycisphaerales bacterium]
MRLIFSALLSIALCSMASVVQAIEGAPVVGKSVAQVGAKPVVKTPSALQMPIHPVWGTPEHTGRLIVMYGPQTGMRAPRTAGAELFNIRGMDTSSTSGLLAKYGCTIRQAINVETTKLESIRTRAETRSGKSMPDLAAMMCLDGIAPSQLVAAGRDFLSLPEVQWVEIETKTELAEPRRAPQGQPCPDPAPQCGIVTAGVARNCPECGPSTDQCVSWPCYFPHPGTIDEDGNFVGFCDDPVLCPVITAVRPGCEVCWDQVCATLANLLGPSAFGGQSPADTCLQTILPPVTPGPFPWNCPFDPSEESIMIQSSPFIAHSLAGAANPDCCREVCFEDVTCCSISWDEDCAAMALGFYDACYSTVGYIFDGGSPLNPNTQALSPLFDATMLEIPPPVTTPGSAPLAIYTTAQKYPDPYTGPNPPPPAPPGIFLPFIAVTGFRGGGLDLASMISLIDQFPGTNGPQLPTIKVAVVEPSALVNHEDLIDPVTGLSKVILESGQTPLVINDQSAPPPTFSGSFYTAPAHGCASLGVLFANENDFGVTGVVPTVRPYFFPTESFEEQGRLLTAMTNAIDQLSSISATDPNPSNVIVLPIAQAGQPLNTIESRAAVITTGLGAGVTFVLAAGNASQVVLEPIEGSEDAIVAGANWPGFQYIVAPLSATVYPGLNYCRANMSNFSGTAPATVHVAAWGKGVCTLGYGDLFSGENTGVSTNAAVAEYETNRLRAYTANWGGTSAAAAQIGGVAAMAQALAKQVYDGQPLSPRNIQELMSDQGNTFQQCGLSAADNPTFEDAVIGETLAGGAGGIAGEGEAPIGGFPNLRRLGAAVITGDFYDGNQTTFQIVCGTLLSGNQFAIRERDNKFVKTRTARPQSNTASSGLGPPVFYPTGNRILDVQVIRTVELQSTEDLQSISVEVTGRTVSVSTAMVIVFIYNHSTNRWNFAPPYIGVLPAVNTTLPQFTMPACVNPSDMGIPTANGVQLAARAVFVPLGGFGQAQIWVDQIIVNYNSPLIDVGPPCGP